jgi:NAD(P)-dependent dehydrogenase (short-subunit alcohol dehydrogenase family)
MIDLSACSAIVTGGRSGLGLATAEALRARGAQVVVADLQGPAPHCDVTQEADVARVIAQAQALGPIACVVNCAGILDGQRIVGKEGPHDLARFERVIQVNLIGTFNVMRLAATAMSQQAPLNAEGERGVIINTASIAAFEGQIGQAAYAASKAGVAALTLPAAREFARFGIRVVCIAPGLFETPMMEGLPEKLVQSLQAHVQFPQRLGHGKEVAQLVLSILDNPMLNGCTLRLDGAVRLMPQ